MKKEKIIKSIENAKCMLVVTNNVMAAEGSLTEVMAMIISAIENLAENSPLTVMAAEGSLTEVMAMIISAIENLAENSPLTEEEILKEIKDVLKIKKEFDKKMEDNSLKTDKMLEKLNVMKKFLEELKK